MQNIYTEQAARVLDKVGATMTCRLLYSGPYFNDDKTVRDVYEVIFTNKSQKWSFKFGQSLARSRDYVTKQAEKLENVGRISPLRKAGYIRDNVKSPTSYDVLSSLTKYDPGTFMEFCSEYGYSDDSRSAEKMYFAVQKEYGNVVRFFGPVIELLQQVA